MTPQQLPPQAEGGVTSRARRSLTSSTRDPNQPWTKDEQAQIDRLRHIWNLEVRGSSIPGFRLTPARNRPRGRLFRSLLDNLSQLDDRCLRTAIQMYRDDEFIAAHGYSVDTFLRHLDRWVDVATVWCEAEAEG